jgi:hypothetical protein
VVLRVPGSLTLSHLNLARGIYLRILDISRIENDYLPNQCIIKQWVFLRDEDWGFKVSQLYRCVLGFRVLTEMWTMCSPHPRAEVIVYNKTLPSVWYTVKGINVKSLLKMTHFKLFSVCLYYVYSIPCYIIFLFKSSWASNVSKQLFRETGTWNWCISNFCMLALRLYGIQKTG